MATMTIRVIRFGDLLSAEQVESYSPMETATLFSEAVEDTSANWDEGARDITVDIYDESGHVHHSHTFA